MLKPHYYEEEHILTLRPRLSPDMRVDARVEIRDGMHITIVVDHQAVDLDHVSMLAICRAYIEYSERSP